MIQILEILNNSFALS